jgi:hypothetical protein
VDYELIASRIKDARKTKDPRERRQIILDWVEKVRLGDGEAVITLRVLLKPVANCQREEAHVDSLHLAKLGACDYILLKIKRRVAG